MVLVENKIRIPFDTIHAQIQVVYFYSFIPVKLISDRHTLVVCIRDNVLDLKHLMAQWYICLL